MKESVGHPLDNENHDVKTSYHYHQSSKNESNDLENIN
jgi:hypothetical protein